ncbi:MAG TPA: 16S rRNA processing protein RimM [Candidatus Faecivivens stercorigallinarum]|nr:16S rRNA processing protein RimM [Candidatus Faecivivens stercorigallinarum]
MEQLLETGKIVTLHALKGEVKVEPWCDSPELLAEFDELYLDGRWVNVERARVQKRMVIMKLEGYDTPEEAAKLIGKVLYIDRDQLELDEGTYFIADLIGMKVVDADDPEKVYGTLTQVSETGANDVYHILFADGVTRYIPAIPLVVISTDVENKVMTIRPLEGLFE